MTLPCGVYEGYCRACRIFSVPLHRAGCSTDFYSAERRSAPSIGSAFQVGVLCAKLIAKRRNKPCFALLFFCSSVLPL
jgi:hypothetical protein